MSFECKFFNKNYCELLNKECKPGQKGCVLNKTNVFFIGETDEKTNSSTDR
ncbi:MAG: hypothetical protein WHS77_00230 [Brevinematales bacterium]